MLSLPTQALVPPPHLYPGRSLSPARTIVVPRGQRPGSPGPACLLPGPTTALSWPQPSQGHHQGWERDRPPPPRPPRPPNQARANLRGAQRNPPHLSHPPSPAQPAQSGEGGLKVPPPFSDPNARPFLTGLPPSRRRATPPSPCRGAAWARASSRWRRRGRARHGVHLGPAGGRGRAGAAPGRGVQTGRGRHP